LPFNRGKRGRTQKKPCQHFISMFSEFWRYIKGFTPYKSAVGISENKVSFSTKFRLIYYCRIIFSADGSQSHPINRLNIRETLLSPYLPRFRRFPWFERIIYFSHQFRSKLIFKNLESVHLDLIHVRTF
jgi:hypothetical protein